MCPSISNLDYSVVEPRALWRSRAFSSQQGGCQQFLLHSVKSLPAYNVPNKCQHVKLLYICVMKSMIQLWEMNAFCCKSESLTSLFFLTLIILFTKIMFAAIVYIRYHFSLHRKANFATLMLTVDHEAILKLITNYSYSHFCSLYFVCRSLCMFPCQLTRLVWRNLFLEEEWKAEKPPAETFSSELF